MSALHAPQPTRPPRLLRSPILLVPSSPSCSPSRRRTRPAPRRRRPTLRTDRGAHIFDQLPWIAALEAAPENTNPCDIADLSLIPSPEDTTTTTSSPGPVRRRKTSPRASPMGTWSTTSSPPDSPEPLTPCDTNSPAFLCPATPSAMAVAPARILFRNLMPVCDRDSSSRTGCITIPTTPPMLDSSPLLL